ncbi:hypothetical protein GY45DRAFT_1245884 [Cubamyces sp. BRFM 1775]|nr:hypothetical protein GY45DRAFT_1245884 [Cubamyces sp. BRFM 1775]
MNSSPSYDDLASWDDLGPGVVETEDPNDIKKVDPRPLPPDIVELDNSIAELEAQIAALKLKREQSLSQRALITRVPAEILCRIFELGVDGTIDLLPTINLVSRQWREVALSDSILWSYIVLDSAWGWRIPSFMRKMHAHLQRSKESKLYIELDLHTNDLDDAQTIMTKLKPHLSRCYSLYVFAPDWPRARTVREYASELGPALECFYFSIDSSESDLEQPVCILTQPCPLLNYVMLEQAPLQSINIATPALRQLDLVRHHLCHSGQRIAYSFKDVVAILVNSRLKWFNMRWGFLNVDTIEDAFRANPVVHELPGLRGLVFDVVDSASISLFLDTFSLPGLESISVHSGDDIHWITRVALSPRQFPSLRLLDLRNFNLSGAGLAPFIRALYQLPQLTGLGLAQPSTGIIGARFFDVLAAAPETTGEWLLPRLEALCLQSCADVSGYELLQVVNARRGAADTQVAKISFLKLSECYLVSSEAFDRLTTLVATVRLL